MALSVIIATGETIEEEMAGRIDKTHCAIWEKLYGDLSQEECNLLFHSTKSATVATGKIMLRQGKAIPRLLFIDSGRVTLFHTKGDERMLVGQLSRGDVLGEETFFDLSIPTFSAGAQSEVRLRFLDKSSTANWEERQPGLLRKLADFCRRESKAGELLRQKQIEKRQFARSRADGKVTAHLLTQDGARTNDIYRGTLSDISPQGVCFTIHSPRLEAVQGLLGRAVDLEFEADQGTPGTVVRGTVVKVGILLHNDFTIHLHLHNVLAESAIERYIRPPQER